MPPQGPVALAGDDTVEEHPGRKVCGKARHRNPVRSSPTFTAWRWGHKGVVLSLLGQFPFARRPWALPMLVARQRSEQWNTKQGRRHKTPALRLRQLTTILSHWFPQRQFLLAGAGSYGPHEMARWQLGARILRCAARWVPAGTPIVLLVEDSTKKKAGRQIEGVGHDRNGAGAARQEYRALRGLNFVRGPMRVPMPGWPSQCVSVPIGLARYLTAEQALKLKLPDQSRSALAREIGDFVAAPLPTRGIRVLGAGGYATKDTLQQLPTTVAGVSRRLITGKLSAPPPPRTTPRRGCPPQNGA
jgi:hypothetical protein